MLCTFRHTGDELKMVQLHLGRTKKGDGMSLNVIVMAIIALIVLVVLILIFTRGVGGPAGDMQLCQNKNGDCFESCASGTFKVTATGCSDPKPVCCVSYSSIVGGTSNNADRTAE